MSIRVVSACILLCFLFLLVNSSPANALKNNLPAQQACNNALGGCDQNGGGPGGATPLFNVTRDLLINRALTPPGLRSPADCTLENARSSLTNYLESLEGLNDDLTLEALTNPGDGDIYDWVDFHIEKELATPWSENVATYGFVGKQLVPTYNGNIPIKTSHITFLVKCDKSSGEMNLVSTRTKHFALFNPRSPYPMAFAVKFAAYDGPGGSFDHIDALLLALNEKEDCEEVVGDANLFLYPGETRLTEAISINTKVPSDGSCGTPPLLGGRVITVSSDGAEITIENNFAHLDIDGHVYANITTEGPYNPNDTENIELVGLRNIDVEAYDGGLCSNEQIVQSNQNGRYDITYPGNPSFLWCQINMPNPSDSRSECGTKLGFIEVKDTTQSYFTHAEDCRNGGTLSDIIFNEPATEYETAQANVFYHTEKVRNWALEQLDSVSYGELDSEIVNAEINLSPSTYGNCYAYYQFSNDVMQFVEESATCFNMAFDTAVYHEYGHFIDSVLGDLSRNNKDYNIRIALSEGWGDALAAITSNQPHIGLGMYKSASNNYIRSLDDNTQWFPPECLLEYSPSGIDCTNAINVCGSSLNCRRYVYGDVWASMVYELYKRLSSEYEDNPTYALKVILSALVLDSRNITEGIIHMLQADNPTARTAEVEAPHLCTIQSVTDKFGFPRERVLELANFQDCFFKTYKDEFITPGSNYNAMFNTLRKDETSNNFYASGFSRNGSVFDTPSKYFHTRIDEQGNVLSNWTPSSLNNIYNGFNDRGKAVIDTATHYRVFGMAGTPINQPGGNFLLGQFNKSTSSGFIEGYGHIPGNPNAAHPLNMAQSVQPLNGGAAGYVISGITTQAASAPENECFPGILCGDAFVGYLTPGFEPEGAGTDIWAFNPETTGGPNQDIFHEAKQIETNEIVIAGSIVENGTRNAVLMRNQIRQPLTGNVFTLDIPDSTTDAVYRDVIKFQDNAGFDAFLAVGFTKNANDEGLLISRVDYDLAEADPEWSLQLDTAGSDNSERATAVMQFADDGSGYDKFLVAGASSGKVVLLKIDENGEKLWCKKYRYFHSDIQGPNLALTSDGTGFLIAGQFIDTTPGAYNPAAIMRITLDGDAPTFIEDCEGYGFPTN